MVFWAFRAMWRRSPLPRPATPPRSRHVHHSDPARVPRVHPQPDDLDGRDARIRRAAGDVHPHLHDAAGPRRDLQLRGVRERGAGVPVVADADARVPVRRPAAPLGVQAAGHVLPRQGGADPVAVPRLDGRPGAGHGQARIPAVRRVLARRRVAPVVPVGAHALLPHRPGDPPCPGAGGRGRPLRAAPRVRQRPPRLGASPVLGRVLLPRCRLRATAPPDPHGAGRPGCDRGDPDGAHRDGHAHRRARGGGAPALVRVRRAAGDPRGAVARPAPAPSAVPRVLRPPLDGPLRRPHAGADPGGGGLPRPRRGPPGRLLRGHRVVHVPRPARPRARLPTGALALRVPDGGTRPGAATHPGSGPGGGRRRAGADRRARPDDGTPVGRRAGARAAAHRGAGPGHRAAHGTQRAARPFTC